MRTRPPSCDRWWEMASKGCAWRGSGGCRYPVPLAYWETGARLDFRPSDSSSFELLDVSRSAEVSRGTSELLCPLADWSRTSSPLAKACPKISTPAACPGRALVSRSLPAQSSSATDTLSAQIAKPEPERPYQLKELDEERLESAQGQQIEGGLRRWSKASPPPPAYWNRAGPDTNPRSRFLRNQNHTPAPGSLVRNSKPASTCGSFYRRRPLEPHRAARSQPPAQSSRGRRWPVVSTAPSRTNTPDSPESAPAPRRDRSSGCRSFHGNRCPSCTRSVPAVQVGPESGFAPPPEPRQFTQTPLSVATSFPATSSADHPRSPSE